MAKRRLCAVTSYLPYPTDTGDSQRIDQLIRALADAGQATTLSVLRPDSTAQDVETLQRSLPNVALETFDLARIAGSMAWNKRIRRLALAAASRTPPQMYTPFSSALAGRLRRAADEFDVVVLIGEPAGLYARHVPDGCRVVWDKANFMTESFGLSARTSVTASGRLYGRLNQPLARHYERGIERLVDRIWVTSTDEQERILRHWPHRRGAVDVIPTVAGSGAGLTSPLDTSGIWVWMSSLGYPPNWDGLRRFVEANSDQFASHGVTLRVIGKGASVDQEAWLAQHPFVEFMGYQDDLAVACSGARLAVIPVWAGGGVKLKTLTFMELGLPFVATTQAMEGIPDECAISVTDDPRDLFIAALSATPDQCEMALAKSADFVRGAADPSAMRQAVIQAMAALA